MALMATQSSLLQLKNAVRNKVSTRLSHTHTHAHTHTHMHAYTRTRIHAHTCMCTHNVSTSNTGVVNRVNYWSAIATYLQVL